MAVDNGEFSMTIMDSAGKKTTTKIHTEIPVGGGTVMTDLIAARDKFIGTMESLILGSIQGANLMLVKDFGNGFPAGDDAVRSKKFIFYMEDDTTLEPYHFTLGTAKDFDGANLKRAGHSNEVDITTAWWTDAGQNGALGVSRIGAINAFARSDEASHDGHLVSVYLVDN